MTNARTLAALRKLEAERVDLLKKIKDQGDGWLAIQEERLPALDRKIAGLMGVSIEQLAAMRPKAK
jgi:hypothetical protein